MTHQYHFMRVSANMKTGPLPVTTTSSDSCPPNCSFRKGGGCYAEGGHMAIHWRAVDARKRGCTLDELCEHITDLPRNQLWRHNQAGDLPGEDGLIDAVSLYRIAQANAGRRGFTYTHYPPLPNATPIVTANAMGFTVNLSAESLEEADKFYDLGVAPVVCVLPIDQLEPTNTPAGRHVIVCPAVTGNTDCLNCGICYQRDREAIVGFPAHGQSARKVEKIFFMKKEPA